MKEAQWLKQLRKPSHHQLISLLSVRHHHLWDHWYLVPKDDQLCNQPKVGIVFHMKQTILIYNIHFPDGGNVSGTIPGRDDKINLILSNSQKCEATDTASSQEVSHSVQQSGLSPVLAKYEQYLQSCYNARVLAPADKYLPTLESPYINLAMIRRGCYNHKQRDEFTRRILHGGVDQILENKTPINIEDLLTAENRDERYQMIVEDGDLLIREGRDSRMMSFMVPQRRVVRGRQRMRMPYFMTKYTKSFVAPEYSEKPFTKSQRPVRLLSKPKDQVPAPQRSVVVYKIPCAHCPHSYIGQTGRRLC